MKNVFQENIEFYRHQIAKTGNTKPTLSVKDYDEMKVKFVFKHIDQKPFSDNKNHMDLK